VPIVINAGPRPLPSALVGKLESVSFPTIGHFLEDGFLGADISTMTPGLSFVGRAITIRAPAPDGVLLHRLLAEVEPGDVIVVDTGSNRAHAMVGAVIATAAKLAGAVGIVVDGVITDVLELRELGVPVFARGTSVLTAKQLGIDDGGINVQVECGGVTISPGDVVMADENGVVALAPEVAAAVVDQALLSDAAEPELIRQLAQGKALSGLSGADEILARIGYQRSANCRDR